MTVTALAVSWNTRELTSLLLWSLRRVLHHAGLEIVVVDNGSTDGSVPVLRALAEAGQVRLVELGANRGHGPALNIGLADDGVRSSERVWILDSDAVVARPDALAAAMRAGASAAVVGEPHWDRWRDRELFGLYSLLVDPSGHRTASFPFTEGGFVIHLGRGSLAHLAAHPDPANPLTDWAKDHHEPHFGGVEGAAAVHAELLGRFRADLVRHGSLVAALAA